MFEVLLVVWCVGWSVVFLWPSPRRLCKVCNRRWRAHDMKMPSVCFECWYSDDEAVQDRAYEVATRG